MSGGGGGFGEMRLRMLVPIVSPIIPLVRLLRSCRFPRSSKSCRGCFPRPAGPGGRQARGSLGRTANGWHAVGSPYSAFHHTSINPSLSLSHPMVPLYKGAIHALATNKEDVFFGGGESRRCHTRGNKGPSSWQQTRHREHSNRKGTPNKRHRDRGERAGQKDATATMRPGHTEAKEKLRDGKGAAPIDRTP